MARRRLDDGVPFAAVAAADLVLEAAVAFRVVEDLVPAAFALGTLLVGLLGGVASAVAGFALVLGGTAGLVGVVLGCPVTTPGLGVRSIPVDGCSRVALVRSRHG